MCKYFGVFLNEYINIWNVVKRLLIFLEKVLIKMIFVKN